MTELMRLKIPIGPKRALKTHLVFNLGVFLGVAFLLSLSPECAQAQSRSTPTIRSITYQIRDIFEGEELAWLYRTANAAHIATRQEVIARELLFKEGDAFDEFLIRESERNLRTLSYIRKISITPSFDGDYVDLLVSVQDTWTLIPVITYSSGTGEGDNRAAGISESNIFGYGKRLETVYKEDRGQSEVQFVWEDPRLWGTRNRLLTGYFDRSDGYRYLGSFGRPFRSLVERRSWFFNT
ncbi:MAG: hypothetical protein KDD53_06270, partial [Bdellovibrionales bacterium]|nr:hypothetical protein [Bdellovibrionales bacterium]